MLGKPPRIRIFADTSIETGEEWRNRIHEEMDRALVVVLLVSADFLTSDFVQSVEIPRAALAARRGEAVIACLYVRHCAAEAFRIHVDDPSGKGFDIRVTDYQGLNDPNSPMARKGAKREQLLAQAAGKIVDLAEARVATEAKHKAEEERRQQEVEAKAKEEAGARAKAKEEARAKAEADAKATEEAEARAKAEEARLKAEAEARAKAEAEAKAKEEAEAKAKEEAEARAKAEEEARAKAEAEAKAEEEARAKAEAEAKATEEAKVRAKAEEARLKAEAEVRAKAETEAKRKVEEKRRQREAKAKHKAETLEYLARQSVTHDTEEEKRQREAEAKRRAEEERRQREAKAKRKAEEKRIKREDRTTNEGKRPVGLTALAVINFVFSGFGIYGLYVLLSIDDSQGMRLHVSSIFIFGSLAISNVLLLVSGIGYLKQKKILGWAIGNIYAILTIISRVVFGFMYMAELGEIFNIVIWTMICLIYPLVTLILLNKTFKDDLTN